MGLDRSNTALKEKIAVQKEYAIMNVSSEKYLLYARSNCL